MGMCQAALHLCDCECSLLKLKTWNLIVQNSNESIIMRSHAMVHS